jgi:A/G-specific adenine glycosylase
MWLLWAQDDDGSTWLERRPAPGVWGGLFCLPVFASYQELGAALPVHEKNGLREMPVLVHALTHKDLHLHPVRIGVAGDMFAAGDGGAWFSPARWTDLGLPAPVRKLLNTSL